MKIVEKRTKDRIKVIERWLAENGGEYNKKQSHLVDNTTEQIYWHYGYMMALKDTLCLLRKEIARLN